MWTVEYCHSFPLFVSAGRLLLVDGGHASTQTEGEIVTGNSRFQDCDSGGECLPGQLDLESSAVSATKGRIRKAVTGGDRSQRNSLTIGKKVENFTVPAVNGFCFLEAAKTLF